MVENSTDYNSWHSFHTVDDDNNTPWHSFVKNKLNHLTLAGLSILEIGCGRGGFSNYLGVAYPNVYKIVASDFSTEALRIAYKKYGDHNGLIEWRQEDIMSQKFENNTFDIAISCETIEHIPNPRKAIEELYRVLKPGGILLLTLQLPKIYFSLTRANFKVVEWQTTELIIPARVPKHFWNTGLPAPLKAFGHRTFFILKKTADAII